MKGAVQGVLTALNEAKVRYIVVGGVAVVLHGYLRTTADLDLVIQLERENVINALHALKSVGYVPKLPFQPEQFADSETRQRWIDEKGMMVFPLYADQNPLLGVDIFVREPFDFDSVYNRSHQVDLDRTTATVIALEDLIEMKQAAARPRDVEDVRALQALRRQRDEG